VGAQFKTVLAAIQAQAATSATRFWLRPPCFARQSANLSGIRDGRDAVQKASRRNSAAKILEGTGQGVSLDELDGHGRFRRIATGWGELA
jgi:hypothetical protein